VRKADELRQVGHRRPAKKPGTDRRPELRPAQGNDDEVQPFRHEAHDEKKNESNFIGVGADGCLPAQIDDAGYVNQRAKQRDDDRAHKAEGDDTVHIRSRLREIRVPPGRVAFGWIIFGGSRCNQAVVFPSCF
jgi:hypothetical protein